MKSHPAHRPAKPPRARTPMRLLWTACLLLTACDLSQAGSPGGPPPMQACTAEQVEALAFALNRPAFAPRKVEVTVESGGCYQITQDRMLAFAVFIPAKHYPDAQEVSAEALSERSFNLLAGLFDTQRRRIVSRYVENFPSSGWIQTDQSRPQVLPVAYGSGTRLVFAIRHDQEPGANAADFHVSVTSTLLMQHGAALKPVLRDLPLHSRVALTPAGGVCCAHVLMDTARTLIPTDQQTRGMPDLTMQATRDVQVDATRGPVPKDFANIPKTYTYALRFDGAEYRAAQGGTPDAWDAMDR